MRGGLWMVLLGLGSGLAGCTAPDCTQVQALCQNMTATGNDALYCCAPFVKRVSANPSLGVNKVSTMPVTLTVTGWNLAADAAVYAGGTRLPRATGSSPCTGQTGTCLWAELPMGMAGTVSLSVTNPEASLTSNAVTLTRQAQLTLDGVLELMESNLIDPVWAHEVAFKTSAGPVLGMAALYGPGTGLGIYQLTGGKLVSKLEQFMLSGPYPQQVATVPVEDTTYSDLAGYFLDMQTMGTLTLDYSVFDPQTGFGKANPMTGMPQTAMQPSIGGKTLQSEYLIAASTNDGLLIWRGPVGTSAPTDPGFSPMVSMLGYEPKAVLVEDMDGDGTVEVLVQKDATTVEVLSNADSYVSHPTWGTLMGTTMATGHGTLTALDLDGDGHKELVSLDPTQTSFIVWNSAGMVLLMKPVTGLMPGAKISSITTGGDVDNLGPYLLLSDPMDNKVLIYSDRTW